MLELCHNPEGFLPAAPFHRLFQVRQVSIETYYLFLINILLRLLQCETTCFLNNQVFFHAIYSASFVISL